MKAYSAKVVSCCVFKIAKLEKQFIQYDDDKWLLIYKTIHNKKLDSNLRSFNYKFLLFDGLPTSDKYNKNKSVTFAQKETESLKHTYEDFLLIKNLFAHFF